MSVTKITYVNGVTVIGANNLNEIQDEINRLDADKADLDSPALTGTPTAPTPTEGDSSTKIATTEFVADLVGEAAQVDGSYPDMSAGGVISSTYTEDSEPYTYRQSPSADIEVDEIVGGSVGWNQLLSDNGSFTVESGAQAVHQFSVAQSYVAGHKYLASINQLTTMSSNVRNAFRVTTSTVILESANANYNLNAGIRHWIFASAETTDSGSIGLWVHTPNVAVSYKDVQLHDLTAMFGSTIADYVYSLETATAGAGVTWLKTHFPRMFGQYNAYDAGSIKSVEGVSAHKMVGKNLLPNVLTSPVTTYGITVTSNADGSYTLNGTLSTTSVIVSNLFTGVIGAVVAQYDAKRHIPNGTYRISLITTASEVAGNMSLQIYGSNAPTAGDLTGLTLIRAVNGAQGTLTVTIDNTYQNNYARLTVGAGTYNNVNVKLAIIPASESAEYEPYETWSYPLDSSLELRGIPKLDSSNNLYYDGDIYASDGTVTRNTILRAYQSGDESLANAITDGTNTVVYSANASTESATPYQNPQRVGSTEEYVTDSIVSVGHNSKYYDSFTVPKVPSTDGTYILKVTISGGFPSYTWEATE